MTSITIAQTPPQVQSSFVYEYAFSVFNPEDKDTQHLTAAFKGIPTSEDWKQWLSGWNDTGYQLQTKPQLIRII